MATTIGSRVFLVRPWHNPAASLYPYVMDGVEYIDAVIKKLKDVLESAGLEVRVDEAVFVPGLTLRENLQREITNADLVLVLLDGLRPNVVYELGFAYGQRVDADQSGNLSPKIICLAEKNATVLVRNYYPEPLAVPTADGGTTTILNPRLDVSRMLSDNADLLVLTYDRLNLDETLGQRLRALIEELRKLESKQAIVSEASGAVESDRDTTSDKNAPVHELWELYEAEKYADVVTRVHAPSTDAEKKVLALSLMKLGRLYEAIQIWKELEAAKPDTVPVLFHLGICYFAVNQIELSVAYLEKADNIEKSVRTKEWLVRAGRKRSVQSVTSVQPQ